MAGMNTNGNGITLGLPGWAKAIAMVGTPSVIAIILIAVLIGAVPSALTRTQDAILVNQAMLKSAADVAEKNRRILLQICRNTAKTETQSSRCDEL